MEFKYSSTIPVINLKFTCSWGKIKENDTSFIPTFSRPIIIEFEDCTSSLKLWKKDNKWSLRIIKNKKRN